MKTTLLIFTILSCTYFCFAQTESKIKNQAILFELGQTGLIYNISYDQTFQNKKWGLRSQVGANFVRSLPLFKVSVGGFKLIGNQNHFLEVGADVGYLNVDEVSDDQRGLILFYPDFKVNSAFANLNIGFRNYGKKSIFRIGFSPLVYKEGFIPGGYLGFGFRF